MFSAGCSFTGRAAFASKSSLHLPTWRNYGELQLQVTVGEEGNTTHEELSNHIIITCHNVSRKYTGTRKRQACRCLWDKGFPLTSAIRSRLDLGIVVFGSHTSHTTKKNKHEGKNVQKGRHSWFSFTMISLGQATCAVLLRLPKWVSRCKALWHASLGECS